MKILDDYNKFAFELLIEADEAPLDDKEKEKAKSQGLVYKGFGNWGKDKEGPTTHKNVDGKLVQVDKDKGDDDDSGQKLGGSDFDRDSGDAPPEAWDVEDEFGGEDSEVAKYLKSLQGKEDDEDDEGDIDRGKFYGGRGFGDDDDLDDEPKGEPKYEPNRNNADNAKKELADISIDLETHEGDIPKSVKRQVDQHTQDIMAQQGIYKNDDGEFATDDGKVLSSDSVHNILSRETGRTENEVAYMLGKAGLSQESVQKNKPFLKEQLERFGGLK